VCCLSGRAQHGLFCLRLLAIDASEAIKGVFGGGALSRWISPGARPSTFSKQPVERDVLVATFPCDRAAVVSVSRALCPPFRRNPGCWQMEDLRWAAGARRAARAQPVRIEILCAGLAEVRGLVGAAIARCGSYRIALFWASGVRALATTLKPSLARAGLRAASLCTGQLFLRRAATGGRQAWLALNDPIP